MTVHVRLFAALRDAAGSARLERAEHDLALLLRALREEFGEPFTSRLARSKIVVDGDEVRDASGVRLAEGAEVALLPPFSGG